MKLPHTKVKFYPELKSQTGLSSLSYFVFFIHWSVHLTLEHVYIRPKVNLDWFEISNRFEMSFRLHGNLHGDVPVATFQTLARFYCTYANDVFYLMQT